MQYELNKSYRSKGIKRLLDYIDNSFLTYEKEYEILKKENMELKEEIKEYTNTQMKQIEQDNIMLTCAIMNSLTLENISPSLAVILFKIKEFKTIEDVYAYIDKIIGKYKQGD